MVESANIKLNGSPKFKKVYAAQCGMQLSQKTVKVGQSVGPLTLSHIIH